jgi:DNA-directed RNA polymerase subunit K/omega
VTADENKAVVIALREIAAGRVMPDYHREEPADETAEPAASEEKPASDE